MKKPDPPDAKLFLTDALQRYDFTVKEDQTELLIQFRRGGRHADGLVIGVPDKMAFDGIELQPVNAVESGGEFLTQLAVAGFRHVFKETPDGGMLSLTSGGTTYFHKIEVPNIRFGKFPATFDRKTAVRLPIVGADKIGRGIWKVSLKRAIWANIGPFWLPGESKTNEIIVGREPSDKVYFDQAGQALVLDLAEFGKAPATAFYSVQLSAVFPCNSTDDPAVTEKKTGIECTYQLPEKEIFFPGQMPPKPAATPATSPTPTPDNRPIKRK